jgi:cystathionine beta-lyase
MPGHRYTPFASISKEFLQHSITCISPSKGFNLAGLQIANIIAADADIRRCIDRAININEVCDVNPFGVEALIAAYTTEGAEWLDALNAYLAKNYDYLRTFFAGHLPLLGVTVLEGTYLVWIDCRSLGLDSQSIAKRLLDEVGLMVNAGTMYGAEGEGFIRINIACPRQTLSVSLERLLSFYNKTR